MQRWIKKYNFKVRAVEGSQKGGEPPVKKIRKTVWSCHQQRYGQTEGMVMEMQILCIITLLMLDLEGRQLMTTKPAEFNREASKAYHKLTPDERAVLEDEAGEVKYVALKRTDIVATGRKIFGRIQKSVRKFPPSKNCILLLVSNSSRNLRS